MRAGLGCGIQRSLNHMRHLRVAHRPRPARPIFVGQPFNPGLRKTTRPFANRVFVNSKPFGYFLALQSVLTQQHHPAKV